jgi:hypothetical protein
MTERKRVIYAACSIPAWVDVAEHLQRDYGWDPVYWIGRSQIRPLVEARFPGVVFHEHGEAMWARGLPPPQGSAGISLDSSLVDALADVELLTLRMMDRIDYAGLLSFSDRQRLYYDHLRIWSSAIDDHRIDLVFNPSTPHQIYDFVIQEICRTRGIPTRMFGLGFDLNLIFAKDDYRESSGVAGRLYAERVRDGASAGVLADEIRHRFEKLQRGYEEAMPVLVADQLNDNRNMKSSVSITAVLKTVLQSVRYGGRILAGALSTDSAAWERAEEHRDALVNWLYREIIGPLRLAKLRTFYGTISSVPDFSAPYIYVPLAYQPELSSSPEGGVFVEQQLMIEQLSRTVPNGWRLYVKEHPIQFTYSLGVNRSVRSHDFYRRIAALPNVSLLPLSANPFALIDKARAIATVTGTTGWEALVRGRPVLHFGYPWWQGCEGAFYTPDMESCRAALGRIAQGYRVDADKVRLFAEVAQECSVSGDIFWKRELHSFSARENLRVAELVRQMADLIGKHERDSRRGAPAVAGAGR